MSTITLIGLDGAGKTTIARLLMQKSPETMRYLYMGTAIGSSNHALPTSRLIHALRERKASRRSRKAGEEKTRLRGRRKSDTRGSGAAILRLLHRTAEEWYRQFVSWSFQLRGFVVLYDRHFIFECAPDVDEEAKMRRLSDRIHFWMLTHIYPRPGPIFFLDAPPEVLFERKPETELDYLATRREAILAVGRTMSNFILVDATQTPEKVLATINDHIRRVREQ